MADSYSFPCPHCSAVIRYTETQIGQSAKCPHCTERIVVPRPPLEDPADNEIVLGNEDERPVRLAGDLIGICCARCGKKVKAGVTRCKECREAVQSELASRMAQEIRFESAAVTKAQYVARKRSNSFPSTLHLVLMFLTLGSWFPIYYLLCRDSDLEDESKSKRKTKP